MSWVTVFDVNDSREQKRAGVEAFYASQIRSAVLDMAEAEGRTITEEVLEQVVAKGLARVQPLIDEVLAHVDPGSRH